jgi:hypothetical protein
MLRRFIHGAMNPKPRLTKQGLRDLNHYGPKPSKAPATSKPAAPDAEPSVAAPTVPEKSDAPSPIGA